MKHAVATLITAIASLSATAYDTPTMGWSSWNTYRVNISDSLIMRQADALVDLGLDSVGYRYINIDDGYFGGRDNNTGRLLFHPERFPNGLKPVVDHIHSLGLKAGIYSDAGANTCGSFWDNDTIARGVGLLGHEVQDCDMFFNEIGFDFIKVDYCGADGIQSDSIYCFEPEDRYTTISEAIRNTGRDDVRLNVCRWNYPGTWVSDVATSWRTTHDINPTWESVKNIIAENLYMAPYASRGHFNDMDMLEIGRTLSSEEDITHFAMWCMMSSPLLIGCDLTTLTSETIALLKNKELVSLNQDPLAIQAIVAKADHGVYILVKDLKELRGTTRAVAFYNPTDNERVMTLHPSEIELGGTATARDLIFHNDLGIISDSLKATIPPHGTRVFAVSASSRLPRKIYEAEQAYLGAYQEIYNPIEAGTAFYMPCDGASGGMAVANLGMRPSNDLLWQDVFVPEDGEYEISLTVKADKESEILVFANGGAGRRLKTSGNGFETIHVTLPLRKGDNNVRLASPYAAPIIDKMTVTF